MISHGHIPDPLQMSTIIPIIKKKRTDLYSICSIHTINARSNICLNLFLKQRPTMMPSALLIEKIYLYNNSSLYVTWYKLKTHIQTCVCPYIHNSLCGNIDNKVLWRVVFITKYTEVTSSLKRSKTILKYSGLTTRTSSHPSVVFIVPNCLSVIRFLKKICRSYGAIMQLYIVG